jgi:hypothetical protein
MEDTIMKKEYINPEMLVVKIASTSQLLAGSTLGIGDGYKDPVTEADAREFDFEDEDLESDFDMGDEEI